MKNLVDILSAFIWGLAIGLVLVVLLYIVFDVLTRDNRIDAAYERGLKEYRKVLLANPDSVLRAELPTWKSWNDSLWWTRGQINGLEYSNKALKTTLREPGLTGFINAMRERDALRDTIQQLREELQSADTIIVTLQGSTWGDERPSANMMKYGHGWEPICTDTIVRYLRVWFHPREKEKEK